MALPSSQSWGKQLGLFYVQERWDCWVLLLGKIIIAVSARDPQQGHTANVSAQEKFGLLAKTVCRRTESIRESSELRLNFCI